MKVDVPNIKADAKHYNRQCTILEGDWSPFWHDAIDFLCMENLLIGTYLEQEFVDAIFEHLEDLLHCSE